MWKLGVLLALASALTIPYVWPDYAVHLKDAWASLSPSIVNGLYDLIDANSRLMAPLVRLFSMRDSEDINFLSPEDDNGLFEPPMCLRNPLAEPQLEKHKHLAILGHVFDVSENDRIYGPRGIYSYLTGILIDFNKLLGPFFAQPPNE